MLVSACSTTPQPIERGTISEASYINDAESQLYRWWGLVESPRDFDLAPQLEDLFDEAVDLELSGIKIIGAEGVKAGFAARPIQGRISHHIHDVRVTNLGNGVFGLDADFTSQVEENGTLRSNNFRYEHELTLQPDGRLLFSKIRAIRGEPADMDRFQSSYAENRARATIIRFQAVMDTLGDPEPLRELILPDATFNGLLTPPADGSSDLEDWDSTLQGYDELAEWFENGPTVFRQVSHRLESFDIKPLGDNRYEATAQFEWIAETLDGRTLEKHTPRRWVLVDDGGKYMRIEALL